MMDAGRPATLFERSLRDATEPGTPAPALDAALDELGWHDALADDPRAAVSLLFELQGATGATSSALGRVLAHALGLARPGSADRAARRRRVRPAGTRRRTGRCRSTAWPPPALADRPTALVVASTGGGDGDHRRHGADGVARLHPVAGSTPTWACVRVHR